MGFDEAGRVAYEHIYWDQAPTPRKHLAPGPNAAAQTRIVSVARIRLDSHKSRQPFKGILCDDVSEFESCRPSHAVGLCEPRTVSGWPFTRAKKAPP
jgi:hypothetical protein